MLTSHGIRIVRAALAVGLAWLYMWVVPIATVYAGALSAPSWWSLLFPSRGSGILTWLVTVHTCAVLLASLPFALAIEFVYGRTGVWIALALTVAVYSVTTLPSALSFFGGSPLRLKLVTLFDAAKLVGTLPALVWILSVLPPKYRIERRSTPRLPHSSVSTRHGLAASEHMPHSLVARIEKVFPEQPVPDMTLLQAQLAGETLNREISEVEWLAAGDADRGITWTLIEPSVLVRCDAALSHLTEEGFVYYIPAYMRLALNQLAEFKEPEWDAFGSVVFQLTHLNGYSVRRYRRFTDLQTDVVIAFLKEVRSAGGTVADMAEQALAGYWQNLGATR